MKTEKILEDTSDYMSGVGILSTLTTNYSDVPWSGKFSGEDLDLDYYLNRSGTKVVSRLVEKLLDENGVLTQAALNRLSQIIYSKYINNWKRVFEAFDLEYNPILNYSGDENSTDTENIETSRSNTLTSNSTTNNTGTVGVSGSRSNTGTQATTGKTEYKGSESDSGSKQNTGTQGITGKTEYKGSESESGSKQNTGTQGITGKTEYKGSESESGSKSSTNTEEVNEDTTDNTTHGFNNYTESTIYGKTSEDLLSFTNRESEKSINGSQTDTYTPDNFKSTTESYAKSYVQNRRNAFNNGLTITSDTETLEGVGSGSGGAGGTPGAGNSNKTEVTESGSHSTQHTYNGYKETSSEKGSETHSINLGGEDELQISGSKTDNNTKNVDMSKSDTFSETTSSNRSFTNREDDKSETRTDNLSETTSSTHSFTNREDDKSETRTDNLSETTTATHSFTNREDDVSSTRTDNLTETNNETTTNNLTNTVQGSETGSESGGSTRTLTHEFHRKGNYGIRTSQEMLEMEVELRQKYSNLFDTVVFPNIDQVMTLSIFGVDHL